MFMHAVWSELEWDITWASFWFDTWDFSGWRHMCFLICLILVGDFLNIKYRPNLLLKTPHPVDRQAKIDYFKMTCVMTAVLLFFFGGSGYFELAVWKVLSLCVMLFVLFTIYYTSGIWRIRARLAALAQEDEAYTETLNEESEGE